ncbi:MAG: aminotransferase class V-fold PLP-dependent enzyme, partial [Elusimicrobiota bacterium]
YLDHNATTPVRPEVLEAMLPYLRENYANPSSVHSLGQKARKAIEEARTQVAALIGAAKPEEIVFTSCGSEADMLGVFGAAQSVFKRSGEAKNRVVTTLIEHEAIHGACRQLASRGFEIVKVGADRDAKVSPSEIEGAIDEKTALVSVMLANNEVGTIQPVRDVASACRRRSVVVHTDAVQAVGKIPVDVRALGVDLLSLSGHKFNAPKGVGALYVRSGTTLEPVVPGHQERGLRGGTENTAGIVGLGAAAELARKELDSHRVELLRLRERLEKGVLSLPRVRRTSMAEDRLPGACHFCFEGVDGHNLVVGLDLEGVCVSSGPACLGGGTGLSHVLDAMGVPRGLGAGALRVSLGWGTSEKDVDRFLAVLPNILEKLRAASPERVS